MKGIRIILPWGKATPERKAELMRALSHCHEKFGRLRAGVERLPLRQNQRQNGGDLMSIACREAAERGGIVPLISPQYSALTAYERSVVVQGLLEEHSIISRSGVSALSGVGFSDYVDMKIRVLGVQLSLHLKFSTKGGGSGVRHYRLAQQLNERLSFLKPFRYLGYFDSECKARQCLRLLAVPAEDEMLRIIKENKPDVLVVRMFLTEKPLPGFVDMVL